MTRSHPAWPGIPRAAGVDDYVPADTAQRADAYRRASGTTQSWPIPLTRCGEPPLPGQRRPMLAARPRARVSVLGRAR